MADGRHLENRYIAISQRKKSSDFDEILYTAADFELDERHMIKSEKVALDRLRVRQNVFLLLPYGSPIILVLSASNIFTKFRRSHPLRGR